MKTCPVSSGKALVILDSKSLSAVIDHKLNLIVPRHHPEVFQLLQIHTVSVRRQEVFCKCRGCEEAMQLERVFAMTYGKHTHRGVSKKPWRRVVSRAAHSPGCVAEARQTC